MLEFTESSQALGGVIRRERFGGVSKHLPDFGPVQRQGAGQVGRPICRPICRPIAVGWYPAARLNRMLSALLGPSVLDLENRYYAYPLAKGVS